MAAGKEDATVEDVSGSCSSTSKGTASISLQGLGLVTGLSCIVTWVSLKDVASEAKNNPTVMASDVGSRPANFDWFRPLAPQFDLHCKCSVRGPTSSCQDHKSRPLSNQGSHCPYPAAALEMLEYQR
jgi:hypothetical protein